MAHWLQHTSRDGDMQLHVHSQIAHVARTGKDGKWRAPDSLGYAEHAGAVAAITAQHLEEALTARFGLEWAAREDGNGFEIKGISQEMMDLFSSRRQAITADVRERAARFEERYGRAPSQRELAQLAQASNFATRKGKEGALDLAQAHAGWADRLARTLGVPLASVAPSVWHADAHRAGAAGHPQDADAALARAAAAGPGAGAAGEVRVDPGGPGQAPGPDPAPHRAGPGSRGQAAGGDRGPDPALGVRPGAVPGGPRPGRPAGATWSARTAAASTGATAAPATPRARSCRWRSAWSRRRRPRPRRA